MGDAESDAEQALLSGHLPLRADVLKVGHHGSDAGTSAQFLAAVRPSLAVISVGADNRFGHPAPQLLARLRDIQTLRTDERGRIELVSDGKTWVVRLRALTRDFIISARLFLCAKGHTGRKARGARQILVSGSTKLVGYPRRLFALMWHSSPANE